MTDTLKENLDSASYIELDNIANNIEQKLKLLGIKLPKLAEEAEVDYFTLRKIINRENDYVPNLRVLIKLAKYFNVSTGDLLNNHNLPQYLPLISLDQTADFLNNKLSEFELQNQVFSDSYIHEKGFAIKQENLYFGIKSVVDNICYPISEFVKTGLFVIKWQNKICFAQINNIKNNRVHFTINQGSELSDLITNVKPLAIVVKLVMNQKLI